MGHQGGNSNRSEDGDAQMLEKARKIWKES